jgi:hypothetical protein
MAHITLPEGLPGIRGRGYVDREPYQPLAR